MKFNFQVPYYTNIIFTRNFFFFSINGIFVVFSIKRYILFISALNIFWGKYNRAIISDNRYINKFLIFSINTCLIIKYIICDITCVLFVISRNYLEEKNLSCLRSDLLFKVKESIIYENTLIILLDV